MSRREEIVRLRRQEKLKYLCLNEIVRERAQYNLPPFHMSDPAILSAATTVVQQVAPQLTSQGYTTAQQVQHLVPLINSAIAGIAGGVVNGGGLTDNNEQAYQRMMGGKPEAILQMPYNSNAGEGDPYAALLIHQVRVADDRERKLAGVEAERRAKQSAFLQQQIDLKAKLVKEAREKQIRLELIEQEKHHEWTRQENEKVYQKEVARREEYQRIMEYQQQRQTKVEQEKAQVQIQDQMFLTNIANAQVAADAREQEEASRWRIEAQKTKEQNDLQLEARAKMAKREVEQDKERIRVLIQIQKDNDARRLADLESTKKHQDVLTALGEKAAEKQAANDARIEEQINAAIRRDEIKRDKKEADKASAKAQFLEDQRIWRNQELGRKQSIEMTRKQNEMDEVNRMRLQYMEGEKQDAKKAELKKRQAQDMNVYLRQQMNLRVERDKAARVMMSPHELAMNAGVLSQFSPARKPEKGTSQTFTRAGNNVIF